MAGRDADPYKWAAAMRAVSYNEGPSADSFITGMARVVFPFPNARVSVMKSRLEISDDVVGSSVTATVIDTVRHAVFAGAIAIPMAILGVLDSVETDGDFASAGEMWLDLQNRIAASANENP